MTRARRGCYRLGSLLGDLEALFSGRPGRIAKRIANKLIGRKIVRRIWWK